MAQCAARSAGIIVATPVETLFLDAGGVLVTPNWPRVSVTLGRHGISVGADALEAADPPARRAVDMRHEVDDDRRGSQYLQLVLAGAGVAFTAPAAAAVAELRQYHADHNLWETVPAGTVDVLERLRRLGLKLVVVSNANGTLRSAFSRLGLTAHVDLIVDSHEEGVEKPDPRLFRRALERAGARAETTVHVGDLYTIDVLGARAAGLRAVLVDGAGLYADLDCPRVRGLQEIPEWVSASG